MTTADARIDRVRIRQNAKGGPQIRGTGVSSAPQRPSVRDARRPLRIGLAFNLKPASPILESGNGAGRPSPTGPAADSRTGAASAPAGSDRFAEWDDESTIRAIEGALAPLGEVVRLEAVDDFPDRLRGADPDIVFNVAEGWGDANRESFVPSFCEFWNYPYTGSDPLTLGICLDKSRTKEVLAAHGFPTPEWMILDGTRDEPAGSVSLPVVVKPLHEGSSKGITQRSYCESWDEARGAAKQVREEYGEPAIVEEYLPGREFTVGLIGNGAEVRVLPPVEIDFSSLPRDIPSIYGYEAKWIWDHPDRPLEIFQCPARCEDGLAARIRELVLGVYRTLRCRDWARIDLRLDAAGKPHVLEVNPLPGVIPDPRANSCLPKAARATGLSYEALIQSVLRTAAARHGIRIGA